MRTESAREYLGTLKKRHPEDLNARYPTAGTEATDLLRGMLRFHPEDRVTLEEALAHPFLAPVRRPHDEVGRPEGAITFRKVTPDNIRALMVEEVRAYNSGIPENWQELAAAHRYQVPPGFHTATPGPAGSSSA